jgi:protein-tyrosine phosphatase
MKQRVLFVCLGNICRSPTAEAVFRHLLVREGEAGTVEVDSAGTHGYHTGEPPDPRAIEAAARRGIDMRALRARLVAAEDFARFDLVLAMDEQNFRRLRRLAPPEHQHRLRLFLEFAPALGRRDVPDPYYGGPTGFEEVLDLVEAASAGLLAELRQAR